MNMSHKAEMQDAKYKKYLIKVNKKLHGINEAVKKNHLVVTVGSFLLLLFVLLYTSYDDIKNKSANELMYSVYTYLVGGSLLSQYAIKDAFYELISKIRTALTYDHEFYEIKENFNKLKEAKLIDDKMDKFFRNLEEDYNNIITRPSTTSEQEIANIKSFMQLITDLTATHHDEMNTVLPDDFIQDIISRLEQFIKDYGSASKQLDRELVNPLLLGMIGKEGPPVSAIFLVGKPGVGKCMAVNTPVIMFDGSIKMVQDINIGDLLMGDDSTARQVLSLGRGKDIMYEVVPNKGETYTFNSEHILCLKFSGSGIYYDKEKSKWRVTWLDNKNIKMVQTNFGSREDAELYFSQFDEESKICEISIKNYLNLPDILKHHLKLYRVSVDFPHRDIPFDPYIIGLWIGDGTSRDTGLTN